MYRMFNRVLFIEWIMSIMFECFIQLCDMFIIDDMYEMCEWILSSEWEVYSM